MLTTTRTALDALLATMTETQRAALLDCVSTAVSNAESRMSPNPVRRAAAAAHEGHAFLVVMRDAASEWKAPPHNPRRSYCECEHADGGHFEGCRWGNPPPAPIER